MIIHFYKIFAIINIYFTKKVQKGLKMQGKILDYGMILGNDGNRYLFSDDDVKGGSVNIGNNVDFLIVGQIAKEIYIMKDKDNVSNFLNLGDGEIANVKKIAYIGFGLMLLGIVPFLGFLTLIGGIFLIIALYKISKISKSKTLFKNYIIASVLLMLGVIAVMFGSVSIALSEAKSSIAIIIVGFLVMIVAIYFLFKSYKELAFVTENKLFLISFYVRAASFLLTLIPVLNILLSFISSIIEIYAWYKLEKIKQS